MGTGADGHFSLLPRLQPPMMQMLQTQWWNGSLVTVVPLGEASAAVVN